MDRKSLARPLFALVVCALVAGLFASTDVAASNMAFKLNKQVYGLAGGVKGKNLVALPFNSPYLGTGGLSRLCSALGLTASGQIQMFNGQGGIFTYTCGQVETFSLLNTVGLLITDTADHTGILVGSDVPGQTVTVFDLAQSPVGTNIFPVPYHTTAVNAQDLCVQGNLSGTATITRFDSAAGQVFTHTCGQVPLWNLVLGEAVLIFEDNGPKTFSPSHF